LKYLIINLTDETVVPYPISKDNEERYIGGKALAARILYDLTSPGISPFDEKNILIFNTGPLTGSGAPSASRFNITSRNVLTGGVASSNCGGNFGIKLRKAGLDGIIIYGKAKHPSYITIDNGSVEFHSAKKLWGLSTSRTQAEFDSRWGACVIGPAGEHLVNYATITSEERVAGRTGIGAVMGSKQLKAILARGDNSIPIADTTGFKKMQKQWYKTLREHSFTGDLLPNQGTMFLIEKTVQTRMIPVHNFRDDIRDERINRLTGRYFTKHHLTKQTGCVTCPVQCGRRTLLDGKQIKGPEFETVSLMGPNMDNYDMESIIRWNYSADELGIDTMSLGATLAFAMELNEEGLADFGISFSDNKKVDRLINDIAYRRGKGDDLANGTKYLSEKFGGVDYAPHAKGLELAAYNPRYSVGLGLGYATANRGGCHLGGGYTSIVEGIGPFGLDPVKPAGKAIMTLFMQNLLEAISTVGSCIFTSYTILPDFLHKMQHNPVGKILLAGVTPILIACLTIVRKMWTILGFHLWLLPHTKTVESVIGKKMHLGNFIKLGEITFTIERLYNTREGISAADDKLCRRLARNLDTSDTRDQRVPLKELLPQFYKLRGWDSNGIPEDKLLRRLGIDVTAHPLD